MLCQLQLLYTRCHYYIKTASLISMFVFLSLCLKSQLCPLFFPSYFVAHAITLTHIAANCPLEHQENTHECLSFVLVWLFCLPLNPAPSEPAPSVEDPRRLDWFIDLVKNEAHNIPSFLPQTSAWGQGPGSERGCLRRGGVWGSLWPLWDLPQILLLLCLLYRTAHPPPPGTPPLSFPVERERKEDGEDWGRWERRR